MAEFRTVHTKIWRDEWFCELSANAKVLWLYLITNSATSVAGIYQLPDKFIAFETGLHIEEVQSIKEQFKAAGKIDYDGSVIWVKRMREYQSTSSDKVEKRIQADFNSLPDCRVKGIYAELYGMDTVSVPYPELGSDTDTDTDTETDNIHYARKTKRAAVSCPAEWMDRLYAITKIDKATATVQTRSNLSACGKALIAGHAALDMLDVFERNWYALDWRGKQDQAPTIKQIRDEWGKYSQNGNKSNADSQGHSSQPQYTPEQLASSERINARRAALKAEGKNLV